MKNAERLSRLADLLEARKVRDFATVVKARPTDVQPRPFETLVKRLHCIRCYVGIETDADQGLETLHRWAQPRHNHQAIELVDALDLYVCFNVLLFDPDTTVDSLKTNLEFMHRWAAHPFNFGRIELYAGTPLLQRMQAGGRARGDWLQWDYAMSDPKVERIFQLTARAFFDRNFRPDALANTMMSTRFDVEVVRRFHPSLMREAWRQEAEALSTALGRDSVACMREVIARVEAGAGEAGDGAFCDELAARLRETEERLRVRAIALATDIHGTVKQGLPLTFIGDRVATPLQNARPQVQP